MGNARLKEEFFAEIPKSTKRPSPVGRKTVALLVSSETDHSPETIELQEGRWIISNTQGCTNRPFVTINDATVSACHAVIQVSPDALEVSDQYSKLGTGVTRKGSSVEQRLETKAVTLKHGDELRLGGRRFSLCLIESREQ
jgi:pSer/pThr/pTyr-binding forkhead associated (FHA) protein